jgi:anti-sigma factor RsiW
MQENPRYSLDAIRLLLAQYLDGALDADQLVEVELLLDRSPEAQAELLKLQQAKGRLQQSLSPEKELHFSKVSDTVWKNIYQQLKADGRAKPAEYDFEFISSYYDGELAPNDPERCAFEAQLFHNDAANRALADISAVSEAIRQFGYRQEEACTVDFTNSVMQAYQAETLADSVPPEFEMISAFVDGELPAREIIELNRLIEREPEVRARLALFTKVSDAIRFLAEKLEQQAPGVDWPRIKAQLLEEERAAQVVPLRGGDKTRGIFERLALPIAAAASLLLLSIPSLRKGEFLPDAPKYSNLQLASVPMSSPNAGFIRASYSSSAMHDVPSTAYPSEPTLVPERQLVSREQWTAQRAPAKAPSSEEYLFQTLEEQLPGVDISNFFEK